jgi:N-acetylneuraminic acid mutarotase
MIIWGGSPSHSAHGLNSGAKYDPSTDNWIAITSSNAPTPRWDHVVIWTGTEMIIWGGWDSNNVFNTGGRYNPVSDTWTATSNTNAPTARLEHTAIWDGSEMIIWGGGGTNGAGIFNTGARYDPAADSWTATSTINAPDRRLLHTAVWTGSEMIVWGGGYTNDYNNGGRYNPRTDSWLPISTANAPSARSGHRVVWTGSEMIIWGGSTYNGGNVYFNTGGRYNPGTDSWAATNFTNAPSARGGHTVVWTGNEMIIWGGFDNFGDLGTGGRYNPSADSWMATTSTNAPLARSGHTAVWTGNEMIIWGGYDNAIVQRLTIGGRYCAQPSAPIVQRAVSRKAHGTAGAFDVDLPLSGTPGIECRTGGASGDYTIVVTFLANVSVNASPQAAVTSGVGMIGSGGASNGGTVVISNNIITIPLTNVANAQTINVTLNNVNGSTSLVIPMRVLIGDVNSNGTVNASDVSVTKVRVGQAVDSTNFRADVNANGAINAGDVSIVKSAVGTTAR